MNFLMVFDKCCYILLDYTSESKYIDALHYYLRINYLVDAVSKWCTISECYFLISCLCIPSTYILEIKKYVWINKVTETWLQHPGLEFDLFTCFVCSPCIITYLKPLSCSEFWLLIISFGQQMCQFLVPLSHCIWF